jgi:DNA sulfur modification protein DndD
MTIDELVLHNFSLYRGRQVITFTPRPGRPVILIGGLNGTGKTTILDALQLALYGKLARCSNRGTLAYEEFLRHCIHRKVSPAEGAAVELQFHHMSAGVEHTYRIHRSWLCGSRGVKERVEVLVDGRLDPVLSQAWGEHVEEFIPARIAHLFFFDGEKIESLADFESAAEVLTTAIHSVLGLDLVDRLASDLVVLERRRRIALKGASEQHDITKGQEEIERLEREHGDILLVRGETQNDFDLKKKKLQELEVSFEREGGQFYERRGSLEVERRSIVEQLRRSEDELRELADGPAPLLMVRDLLSAVAEQIQREEQATQAEVLDGILDKRDLQIVETARASGAPDRSLKAIRRFLSDDRGLRRRASAQQRYLHLDAEARESLTVLRNSVLSDNEARARQLMQAVSRLSNDLINVDRTLSSIPEPETVAALVEERRKLGSEIAHVQAKLALLDAELEKKRRQRDQQQSKLVKQIERQVSADLEKEDTARMISHSSQARTVLQTFRREVAHRHVGRIEQLVFDSFQHLLRKRTLVSELRIDPQRFTVELRNGDGRAISAERLSAGERQLLAVSLLWGLARASGRPLPVITDTPLGRLDASHRVHLVERYFPHASHQMILLSTDKEIDKEYYEKLKPWISHSYRLDFDEEVGGTQVRPGYFGDPVESIHVA